MWSMWQLLREISSPHLTHFPPSRSHTSLRRFRHSAPRSRRAISTSPEEILTLPYHTPPCLTRPNRTPPDPTQPHQLASTDLTLCLLFLTPPDPTQPCRTLPNLTEPNRTAPNPTAPHHTAPNLTPSLGKQGFDALPAACSVCDFFETHKLKATQTDGPTVSDSTERTRVNY